MPMSATDGSTHRLHKLYGARQPKVIFYSRDFLDFTVMVSVSVTLCAFCYGPFHVLALASYVLGAGMLITFVKRHGIELRVPVFLRHPEELAYTLLYKVQNLDLVFVLAAGLLLAENLLIAYTPGWPHHTALLRRIALWLFYAHVAGITLYRTAVLVSHLQRREHVREVLMETPWRRVIRQDTDINWEILHAYVTGVLTHIVLLAPWYVVITHARFSILCLPLVCAADVLLHRRWLRVLNAWFYRDHWIGHNSEFHFIYMHGTHHDAIPSGLIAVAENGLLEGFFRYALGAPTALYSPLVAFLIFSSDIKNDIDLHQYIPGVFPQMPVQSMEIFQHSTHHYGQLAPYSMGIKLDQPGVSEDLKKHFSWMPDELNNSIMLDEELSGFKWNNPTQLKTLELFKRHQKPSRGGRAGMPLDATRKTEQSGNEQHEE